MESIIFKTLLHSLWQGVLLALLTALIVLFTTKVNAKLRYILFVGCLVLFVAGVGTTFCIELNTHVPSSQVNTVLLGSPAFGDTVMKSGAVVAGPLLLDNLISSVNKYAPSIVLIWFLVICAKSVRFIVDIRTLGQIRTKQVYNPGKMLVDKVAHLAAQYGIKQKVQILQSGLIKVPMVLGHVKPLILVPLGLINSLSIEEVDAILSHEMAHITRKDYLVNILQSIAEIIFFFNPAVLWVSNLIKTEREHCCDDLAVCNAETKVHYIKALVSCQEFATEMPSYVMAINGRKSQLIHRVQRLVSYRNQSLNKLEKMIIGLVLVSSIGITMAFSGKEIKNAGVVQTEKRAIQLKKEDAPKALYHDNNPLQDTAPLRKPDQSAVTKSKKIKVEKATDKYDMTKDLIADGLIKDKTNLSYQLDIDELVVDGEQQPKAIHRQYMRKYLKSAGQKISVTVSTN